MVAEGAENLNHCLCSANGKNSVFLRRIPLASEKMDGRVLTHGWRGNTTDEKTSVDLRFIFLSFIFLSDVFVSSQSNHGLRAKPAPSLLIKQCPEAVEFQA